MSGSGGKKIPSIGKPVKYQELARLSREVRKTKEFVHRVDKAKIKREKRKEILKELKQRGG